MARCEERNSSGAITSQFFKRGQYSSSHSYFYTKDRNSSVREVSDSVGNTRSEYIYDCFGVLTKVSEAVASEFCYDMYYYHSRSELNLTPYRAYSPVVGRWISRDPMQEDINPYQYVSNNPIGLRDPLGLPVGNPNGPGVGGPNPEGLGTNDGDGGGRER
jgi:RHS repeat-associated protein